MSEIFIFISIVVGGLISVGAFVVFMAKMDSQEKERAFERELEKDRIKFERNRINMKDADIALLKTEIEDIKEEFAKLSKRTDTMVLKTGLKL